MQGRARGSGRSDRLVGWTYATYLTHATYLTYFGLPDLVRT